MDNISSYICTQFIVGTSKHTHYKTQCGLDTHYMYKTLGCNWLVSVSTVNEIPCQSFWSHRHWQRDPELPIEFKGHRVPSLMHDKSLHRTQISIHIGTQTIPKPFYLMPTKQYHSIWCPPCHSTWCTPYHSIWCTPSNSIWCPQVYTIWALNNSWASTLLVIPV